MLLIGSKFKYLSVSWMFSFSSLSELLLKLKQNHQVEQDSYLSETLNFCSENTTS